MARARNIKPAFFDNDELAENDPMGRLLFIGLWTIADYRGNIEWRSKRIKKQILAYDNCDIDELAINLDKSGFIRFYSVDGQSYVHIVNFTKHQNPHKNEREKGSEIPDFKEDLVQAVDFKGVEINHDKSRLKRNNSTSDRADSLIPITDSFNLIPDSRFPQTDTQDAAKASNSKNQEMTNEVFEYWREVMGKNSASKLTKERSKVINDRIKEGYTVEQIKMAIYGCSVTPHNMGQNENNKRYDGIELICRTGSHVERFANNAADIEPLKFSSVTQQNINTLNDLDFGGDNE